MAGATMTGHRAARSVAVTMSSERPPAMRPRTFAVAGATRISCAQSPRKTCGSGGLPPPHIPVWTEPPVTPSKVGGPTNRVADGVIPTRTSLPAWTSADARSTTLYAAIPPVIKSTMRRPRSSSGTGVGSSGMRLSLPLSGAPDDFEDLLHRGFHVVIRHHVLVIRGVCHLALRDLAP